MVSYPLIVPGINMDAAPSKSPNVFLSVRYRVARIVRVWYGMVWYGMVWYGVIAQTS